MLLGFSWISVPTSTPNSSFLLFVSPFLFFLFQREISFSSCPLPSPLFFTLHETRFRDLLVTITHTHTHTHRRENHGWLWFIRDKRFSRRQNGEDEVKNRVTRDSLDFLPFSPSACPPQSRTYPGNKIGRAVSWIADEIIDSSRVDSSKRGIDFFSLSFSSFFGHQFFPKIAKNSRNCTGIGAIRRRVYVLANTFVKFSPEISLVLRHATSSFFVLRKKKNPSILPPPSPSLFLLVVPFRSRATGNRETILITWTKLREIFFQGGGEGIYYSWTAESFAENRFTSGTQSRSRWNIRADYCSIWLIFSHDKLTVLSRDPGIIRSFSTILIIIRFVLIKRLRYFSLFLSFEFATFFTKKRNDARLSSDKKRPWNIFRLLKNG